MKTRKQDKQRRPGRSAAWLKSSRLRQGIATAFVALTFAQGCGGDDKEAVEPDVDRLEIPGGKHCLADFAELVPQDRDCRPSRGLRGEEQTNCDPGIIRILNETGAFQLVREGISNIASDRPYACVSRKNQEITINVCDDDKVVKDCDKLHTKIFIYDMDKQTVSGKALDTQKEVVYDVVKPAVSCNTVIAYRKNTTTDECEQVNCVSKDFPGEGWEKVDSCEPVGTGTCLTVISHRKNIESGECEELPDRCPGFPGEGWEEVDSCDDAPLTDPPSVKTAALKTIAISDAQSLFIANRAEVAGSTQGDSVSSDTPGDALFKVNNDGAVSEVELEDEDGTVLVDPTAPSKIIKGDGYVIMGYGEKPARGYDMETEAAKTVVVRKSDNATFEIGTGNAFYPGVNPEIYNTEGVVGDLTNVVVTPSGSVVYRSATGNLIEININDEAEVNATATVVNPDSHKVDYFAAELDGAILYDAYTNGGLHNTYAAILDGDTRSVQELTLLNGYFSTKKGLYTIAPGKVLVDDSGFNLVEDHSISSGSVHHSIFSLSWDKEAKQIAYTPYAQTSDTGDGYFSSGGRDGQFYLGGSLFLVAEHGGIVEFEPADSQPKVIEDSAVRTILRGDAHLFIHNYQEEIVRLSADGSTEVTAGLDNIEITSVEQDPAGNIIVIGTDLTPDNQRKITGQINQAENTLEIINEAPFQIDATDVIRLN